jgi:hypothetical protein
LPIPQPLEVAADERQDGICHRLVLALQRLRPAGSTQVADPRWYYDGRPRRWLCSSANVRRHVALVVIETPEQTLAIDQQLVQLDALLIAQQRSSQARCSAGMKATSVPSGVSRQWRLSTKPCWGCVIGNGSRFTRQAMGTCRSGFSRDSRR